LLQHDRHERQANVILFFLEIPSIFLKQIAHVKKKEEEWESDECAKQIRLILLANGAASS
jgi:hypothetical protein